MTDGYTLVEMLAALAIIGLAFGGLAESSRVVGLLESQASRYAQALAADSAAQEALSDALRDAGPFRSTGEGGFSGSGREFSFNCGSGLRCGAQLEDKGRGTTLLTYRGGGAVAHVPVSSDSEFTYSDDLGRTVEWPHGNASVSTTLKSLSLVGSAQRPIATVRFVVDEARGCEFDVVAQACRVAP